MTTDTTTTDTDEKDSDAESEYNLPYGDEQPDSTPDQLYSYGIAGEPVRWAPSTWQPVIAALRAANSAELDVAAVQPLLDATFPDAGYQATDLVVARPPKGTFTVTEGDNGEHIFTSDDADLGLPPENIQWVIGNETRATGNEVVHTFVRPGDQEIQTETVVAGRVYGSRQIVTIPGVPAAGTAPTTQQEDDMPRPQDVPENQPENLPADVDLGEDSYQGAEPGVAQGTQGSTTQIAPGAGMPESEPGKTFSVNQPGEKAETPAERAGEQRAFDATGKPVTDLTADKGDAEEQANIDQTVEGKPSIGSESDESDESDESGEYNPADHTVDEVLAYARDHPEEVIDIIEAEEAGKERVTLLDKLDGLK